MAHHSLKLNPFQRSPDLSFRMNFDWQNKRNAFCWESGDDGVLLIRRAVCSHLLTASASWGTCRQKHLCENFGIVAQARALVY